MKLIIQIPCFNEAESLPLALANLPRKLDGIDKVEWLIVDDGSNDGTADIARQLGVDHVIVHRRNRGLARAFMTGLEAALQRGADIIVNTDADNQYDPRDIPLLVQPILAGEADMVIGNRQVSTLAHFSPIKRLLQRLGSATVRRVSRTSVEDAPSGFRCLTRDAAMQLHVFSAYTYTLETIIQAGHKGMSVISVPIRTNPTPRPSRLVRSIPSYVWRSIVTMVRIFVTYRPFASFAALGAIIFGAGFLLGLRFLIYFIQGDGQGHVQSLILTAVLLISGFYVFLAGILADLISVNRKLLEELSWRLWRLEQHQDDKPNGDGNG